MSQVSPTFKNLAVFIRSGLPTAQDKKTLSRVTRKYPSNQLNKQELESEVQRIMSSLDWKKDRNRIAELAGDLMPFEKLVPEVYASWRPIVKETLRFIVGKLPSQELIPKLTQEIVSSNEPLELRLIRFISKMPTLQKLGQIIARNQNLDPAFRAQLILLENSIRDVTPEEIRSVLQRTLARKLKQFAVETEPGIHSEASVSAITRFSWINPGNGIREHGVFKVRKPDITNQFKSEMKLLSGLAHHLKKSCPHQILSEVDLEATFTDVKNHLERELDSKLEQAHLVAAKERYAAVSGVRTPTLIEELSTSTITAMSFEEGEKVTEAYPNEDYRRKDLASQIVEALVAAPLYSSERNAVFHADPHAGNLLVDTRSHELIILDWSLTEELSLAERRQLVMLVSALFLRDEQLIFHAINELRIGETNYTDKRTEAVFRIIHDYLANLPIIHLPKLKDVLQLLDDIALTGVRFSSGLLIFRKVLLTLDGVLKDITSQLPLESVIAHYAFKEWARHTWGMNGLELIKKPIHLSPEESLSLIQSAQWFGFRTGLQTISSFSRQT